MTTINDISDLVQVLQDHPEWRHTIRGLVIGEELAQVPQQLTELERNLAAFIQNTDRRFEATERNFQLLWESQESLRESQQETDRKLASFIEATERNFEATSKRMDELDQRLASFIEATERNFEATSKRMDELDQRLASFIEATQQNFLLVNQRFNRIDGRLDNGFGMNYQSKVEKNIRAIAGRHLNLRRTRIIRSNFADYIPDFQHIIETAEEDGRISLEQSNQLWQLDLAFSGRDRGDGSTMYVAAELSITIDSHDISRVSARASLLTDILGEKVTPAVIGAHIDESLKTLANANDVTVILYPDN